MDRSSSATGGSIDPGVGIWTHGLACLESLGVLRQLESEGRYMGEAGYRDTTGNWLAIPTRPLQEWGAAPMRRGEHCSDESGGKGEDGRLGGEGGGGGASVLFVRESKLMEMWFATVEDGLVGADGGPADKDQHPPSCGGEGEGEGERKRKNKSFLLETFGGWHAPVGSLLRATAERSITREDARAMSRRGLRDITAAAGAARRRSRGGGGGGGVVLVGDSAHTLDPVLAQGAGVALEDAFFLAQHLKDFNGRQNKKSAAVTAGEAGDRLEEALSRYDEERLQRALLLSVLSDVSQALGQLRRPEWLVRARDSTLARYIPAALSSRIFDGLMAASLAGGLAGGARAATAAAVGFGEKRRFGGYRVPKLW
ncbi:monooxygenase FAD-binding [Ectocarpus siliculosus]|uniref:Monooxygenase FAD-binding n=1 Tax=Ectocarpus siliculosus TaxID=2880 RepID=D7G5G3_ECTSI|nr:monooxygenase FAD-binding [Ectocarpus siliculosus]|eukprot:CBJ27286.1 monooxygenase FAD-binding [Ectocarpus siliculosus]